MNKKRKEDKSPFRIIFDREVAKNEQLLNPNKEKVTFEVADSEDDN